MKEEEKIAGVEGYNLPDNMAMKWPHSRVVLHIFEDNKPSTLHKLRVSALRVTWICDNTIPLTEAVGQDPEIVTMQMEGMIDGNSILNRIVHNEAYRTVSSKIVDAPLWIEGVRCISRPGK